MLVAPAKPLTFGRYLDRMAAAEGAGARNQGRHGPRRYRFESPLLQPYVLMRGLSDGTVTFKDLTCNFS